MATPLQQGSGVSFLKHAPVEFVAELDQFGPFLGQSNHQLFFSERDSKIKLIRPPKYYSGLTQLNETNDFCRANC